MRATLRFVPPAELLTRFDGPRIDLGAMSEPRAARIRDAARSIGLRVLEERTETTHFLPRNRLTQMMWVIEAPEHPRRVTDEMRAAGIPVVKEDEAPFPPPRPRPRGPSE